MSQSDFDSLSMAPRLVGPWSADHLHRVLLGNAAGFVLVGTGWWQVSGTSSVSTQVSWLIAGIVGIGAAGLANASWLQRGMQSVSSGRNLVLPEVVEHRQRRRRIVNRRHEINTLVTVAGTQRFHRPSCALVAGKPAEDLPARARSSLLPCEVCEPS